MHIIYIERTVGDGVSSSSGTGAGVVTLASVGKGVDISTGGSVSGGRDAPGVGASVLFVPRTPSPPPSSMSPTAATRMSFASVVVVAAAAEDAVSSAAPCVARPMTSAAAV